MSTPTVNEELARADGYRLFSACFYQPEEAFVEEDVFGQLATALKLAGIPGGTEARSLADQFHSTGVDELLLDYTRLFLGPFGMLAKPYGSIYLDGRNQVMSDSTQLAQELYAAGGFEVDEEFCEAPDHVAVELEFLYLLSHRLAEARNQRDDVEVARLQGLKQQFLQDHLGRWIDPFAELVRNGAETVFYRTLIDLTQRFIHHDRQTINGSAASP